jgi:hypothetical protein
VERPRRDEARLALLMASGFGKTEPVSSATFALRRF